MSDHPCVAPFDQWFVYRIQIQGRLSVDWSEWLDHLTVTHAGESPRESSTELTGPVRDQVELHGLLARIRDLGLVILSVQCLGPAGTPGTGSSASRYPTP